ncbi:GTP-binding protein, partial [Enterocloster lavalensis]
MRLITVSGPPSSGKTSVVIRAVEQMGGGEKVMVVKFDCLSSTDQERYQRAGIRAVTGLSGNQCPDHFYISNVEDCAKRAQAEGFEYLIVESAGLCNRCAPHLKD